VTATIYFSGSITGGRGDIALYQSLIRALEEEGHRVLAGAVAAENVSAHGESISRREIFERDLRWLDESDVVVAEVTTPSHGVGYEIAYARWQRKVPVIALTRRRCSAMIEGDPGVQLIEYDVVETAVPRLLESIRRTSRYPARLP
jgi:nucleoside 2-deoxyribosyltransferase